MKMSGSLGCTGKLVHADFFTAIFFSLYCEHPFSVQRLKTDGANETKGFSCYENYRENAKKRRRNIANFCDNAKRLSLLLSSSGYCNKVVYISK